jgi:hypothetical protein
MRDQMQLECFVRDIERSFAEAWDVFVDYEHAATTDRDVMYYEGPLRGYVESLYIRLLFAFEILGLTNLLADLRSGYEGAHRDAPTAIDITDTGYPYSPALDFLERYFRPLRASVPSKEENEKIASLQHLERVLRGTPKLIRDRKLKPKNETEIRNAMYDTLIHFYPDAVRDVPIAKQSKTYKPDIGVPSLKAAVEYKFADSEVELKKALGGIYEDVGGYAGSEDWKNFFAVIYMTDDFLTQAQVDAEFHVSKVDRAWKPLLITGRGGRKRRKPAKKSAS